MPGTITIRAPEKSVESETNKGWKVLLYNDDVTPIDVVVFALQRAAGLSLEVAEMIAVEAHESDVAVVKRGLSKEDALVICGGLRKWTRIEGVCGGVTTEAEPDE